VEIANQRMGAKPDRDAVWNYWFVVPLYPYRQRRTLRREVIPGTLWTFDQVQGVLQVIVPIRMTIVKLEAGGLLVYAPIAPTPECIRLVKELVALHGEVRYIILPTISGLEHKVFVGPFARQFPTAQVFVAPNQWSFPVNLPLAWLGLPRHRTQVLPESSADAPFAAEFDYAMLGPIALGPGKFAEVAFFHRRSQTLLVTDSVLVVPDEPPTIVQQYPQALLFHAKDHAFDRVEDTPATRRKGWQRIALFTFYFRPSAMQVVPLLQSLREALQTPDRSAYFGWFPFHWQPNWYESFAKLRRGGRLLVAPILQALILNRDPAATIAWADRVASWPIQQIIPCHLEAPIAADAAQFRQAFGFLEQADPDESEADFTLLRQIDTALHRRGIVPPPQPLGKSGSRSEAQTD
jgi:hypothetical protein